MQKYFSVENAKSLKKDEHEIIYVCQSPYLDIQFDCLPAYHGKPPGSLEGLDYHIMPLDLLQRCPHYKLLTEASSADHLATSQCMQSVFIKR